MGYDHSQLFNLLTYFKIVSFLMQLDMFSMSSSSAGGFL